MQYPTKYNKFGYQFLSQVNATTLHPGVDLNWNYGYDDFGQDVVSITKGEVVYSGSDQGWGHHIIIYHANYGVWTHYAHLKERFVRVGDKVNEGQVIGLLGGTGRANPGTKQDWSPHLHFEVWKKERSFNGYTKNWSREKVLEHYHNPLKWVAEQIENEKKVKEQKEEDQRVSDFAKEHWEWATENGYITNTDPKFTPNAEWFVTVLHRYHLDQHTPNKSSKNT